MNTMDIVVTGNYTPKKTHMVHNVLRPGYTLHVGTRCHDGRPIQESWRYQRALALGLPIIRQRPILSTKRVTQKLFTTKYTPTAVNDIIGHKDQIQVMRGWFQALPLVSNTGTKGLLVTGPPGIGKTTTVHLMAKEFGYRVTEYNASDTRSVSMLKGILALGMHRLSRDLIVMDEVDGLVGGKERGSVGELAALIRASPTPIVCIANDRGPKLTPLVSACLDVKFQRPMKSTIAAGLMHVVTAEGLSLTKADLEQLCEKSGNDIRSILNTLDFFEDAANGTASCKEATTASCKDAANGIASCKEATTASCKDVANATVASYKDAVQRLDHFSATQRLFSAKTLPMGAAEDLVYVDYHMVPLMVQEGYAAAAATVDELERASALLSEGDVMGSTLWQTQEWTLLPLVVATTVAVAKTVTGAAPFQLFPQFLGKNSKRLKHERWMQALAQKQRCSATTLRLDVAGTLRLSLWSLLQAGDTKKVIQRLEELGVTRDDLMETLCEVSLDKMQEIPTKVKSALTREWNKRHGDKKSAGKEAEASESEEESEIE